MARMPPARQRWRAARELFVSADDPYAGADLPSSRNAAAVLSALHGVLILILLPLFPPDEAIGAVAGWGLALAGVAMDLGAAVILLSERRRVWFDFMLVLAYLGIAQLLLMQVLADTVLPYQLLMLVWVGAAAVQPTRRAGALLLVLLLATLAPIAVGAGPSEDRDVIGRALLFAAIGLVLIAYVANVRAQRVTLSGQERDARAEAMAATKRVRDLQWITDAALPPLGLQELLDQLLARIVPVFEADQGAILLSAEESSRLELRAAHGLAASGGPEDRSSVGALAARIARSREAVAFEHEGDPGQAVLGVPLLVDRGLLGVLYVATRERRSFTEDDAALLQLVGDRVALALDRARMSERERHIAETLQRSLLPEQLPRIPGAVVAARYLPAGSGLEVGGDWYDVFELHDGRIGLAMGDVVGRGVRAAALMGKLRTALEAYALDGRSPEEVLERLHALMERHHRSEMATLLYVVIAPVAESATFASAGHLPPILRSPDGSARLLADDVSPPLGAVAFNRFQEIEVDIRPGSTLLLYTDGLVEEHGRRLDLRLEELRDTADAGPPAPEALCDFLLARMLRQAERKDDVALLALQLSAIPAEGFELDLPAEPEVLASVRTALALWLKDTAISREDVYAVKVACGEACANAVEHAYRPGDAAFRLEASRSDDEVVITVNDFGTWRAQRGVDRGRGFALMEALMDSVHVTPTSTGTTVQLRRRLGGS